MINTKQTSRELLGVTTACATAAGIALAPTTHADGSDGNFLAMLSAAGIPAHDGIPAVISYGHKVCDALNGGESPSSIADTLAQHAYAEDPSHPLDQYQRTMVALSGCRAGILPRPRWRCCLPRWLPGGAHRTERAVAAPAVSTDAGYRPHDAAGRGGQAQSKPAAATEAPAAT